MFDEIDREYVQIRFKKQCHALKWGTLACCIPQEALDDDPH